MPWGSLKMRSATILRQRYSMSSSVSASSMPRSMSMPWPIWDVMAPLMVTEACVQRCITIRMVRLVNCG